jgi:peptidoglycan/xylan/chitin deacetylase (PgdA/CDA1 family)
MFGGGVKNIVTITFDDAYKSFFSQAIPVLTQYNYPAILFIPVGFVGQYNVWDSHLTDLRIPILSWDELNAISEIPFVRLGSHGLTHRPLSSLKHDEIFNEIAGSKKIIEEKLQIQVDYFSYPYGQYKHFNKNAIDALKKCDYKAACSTNWGRNNSTNDLYKLNRIEIEPKDSLHIFQEKLSRKFHIKRFKQIVKNVLHK